MDTTPAGEPQRFETILVARDFSSTASAALKWAIEIAKEHGARIELSPTHRRADHLRSRVGRRVA